MCLNPNDIVGGRYEIIKELGRGGFGITYLARVVERSRGSHSIVALKEIKMSQVDKNELQRDPEYIERLEREANILRDLEHSYIPEFLNSFYKHDCYYIVQEYIQGFNLSHEICPGEPIEEQQAVDILQEILNILQFVHQRNIIHRDIKPANIIRRHSDNKLVLIDFGAVTELATKHTNIYSNRSDVTLTKIIYCPGYSPNEQLAGIRSLNSDIYALGIMIMQGVTGFSLRAICDPQRPPRMEPNNRCRYVWEEYAPQISPRLRKIISRMIEYDHQRDRYQSVEEILQDLNTASEPEESVNPLAETLICSEFSSQASASSGIFASIANFYRQYQRWLKFHLIAAVICILSIFIHVPILNSSVCASKLKDHISCGEEILDPFSKGAIRLWAAEKYQQKEYAEALRYYQKSWQKERRDAETLIYLNNALLDANKIKYYTISIAVPLSSNEAKKIKSSATAQDFLRGVAQAQTEVNLSLSNDSNEVAERLLQYNFLSYRSINRNNSKGLKVIIVDDANDKEQARETAKSIAKNKRVRGVIGHYTSRMTLNTVDIYGNSDLAQISYGSTTRDLTDNPRSNFFRVVYSTQEEADALVKYIEQNGYKKKRIAIFYNPSSEYSNSFKLSVAEKIKDLAQPNINIIKEFNLADEKYFSSTSALQQLDALDINICLLLPDGQITNSLAKAIEIIQQDNGQRLMLGGNPLINSKVSEIETDRPLDLVAATFWHPSSDSESKFVRETQQLWDSSVNGGTAMAYDATIAAIEAIKRQAKPTRKGTIEQLKQEDFSVSKTATGEVYFNTPKNGDRLDFYPVLVRLIRCENTNRYISLSLDGTAASNRVCQE